MSQNYGKKHMSPEAVAANRQNAQYSTGPKTPVSSEEMAQRALRHGLSGNTSDVMPWEVVEEYQAYRALFLMDLNPQNIQETEAVGRIAMNNWRLRRAMEYESRVARQYDEDQFPEFFHKGPMAVNRYISAILRYIATDEARFAALKAERLQQEAQGTPRPKTTPPGYVRISTAASPDTTPPTPQPKKKGAKASVHGWLQSFQTPIVKPEAVQDGFELQNSPPAETLMPTFDPLQRPSS